MGRPSQDRGEPPPAPDARARRLPLLASLALVAAAFAVYWSSLDGPFVLDDVASIVENPHLRSLSPLASALSAPPGTGAAGRPVVALSLALSYAISELDVTGWHVFNVVVHALAALALFGLVRRTLLLARDGGGGARSGGQTGDGATGPPPTAAAFAVALLWVVHPLGTDALNQVVYRNEALMALFYLATLWAVARGLASARPGRWFVLAVASCALGMGSKEAMVSCPLVVLLYDRAFGAGSLAGALRRRPALYAGLASTWIILAALVATSDRGASVGLENATALGYAKTQAGVLLGYLKLSVWPAPLVMDYGPLPLDRPLGAVWPAGLAVLALAGLSVWAAARRPRIGLPALAVFLVLAPTTSVVPLSGEIMAEHRMYLPLAAIAVLLVAGGWRGLRTAIPGRRPRAAVAAVLVGLAAAGLGATTVARNRDYATVEGIWRDTIAKRPRNYRAHEHLGDELARQGRLEEAVAAYEAALEIWPAFAKVHFNLANVLEGLGRREEADEHYRLAVRHDPGVPAQLCDYGFQLLAVGRRAEGLARIRRAARLSPDVGLRAVNLLAGAPDPRLRDGAEAVRIAERLAQGPGGADPRVQNALAAALAETGRFEEAVGAARRALAGARAAGRMRLARAIEARLALYEAGRPFRGAP